MTDFGNITYRTGTKAYVIRNNTFTVPHPEDESVPAEIHAEFDALYAEVDAYAKEHPDMVTEEHPYEPTPEEIATAELARAKAQANTLLVAKRQMETLQTFSFSTEEFNLLAKAQMFESWQAGVTYEAGYRIAHEGVVYEVIQKVAAIENQPPNAEGMLAVYRPLSVDVETGEEADGSMEHPYTFIYGMDVAKDKYYLYEEKLYLAKADMPACVWYPGTEGLWQWEEVETMEAVN